MLKLLKKLLIFLVLMYVLYALTRSYVVCGGAISIIVLALILVNVLKRSSEEPAYENYFFYECFTDIECMQNISMDWDDATIDHDNVIVALVVLIASKIVNKFILGLHKSVIRIICINTYIFLMIVWITDKVYMFYHRLSTACPNPSCQRKFKLPVYECDRCQVKHRRLTPGKYGVLKRRCQCNNIMPSTFFNGRGKLKSYCPYCGWELSGDTSSKQFTIPVVGPPSVGKTCYINMAIHSLMENTAPSKQWNISFANSSEQKEYDTVIEAMKKGYKPAKTDFDSLTAYQLMMKIPTDSISRRIYLYDIAGEQFTRSGAVLENKAFSYVNGIVFLIDPLSIDEIRYQAEENANTLEYGISSIEFDDVLDVMLNNFDTMLKNRRMNVTINNNFAVVINKMDVPLINEQIGNSAAEKFLRENKQCRSIVEAQSILCREFLMKYRGNFVRKIEYKFKNVKYFACSSLGHCNNGQAYAGINVENPLLWILSMSDNGIKMM